RSWPRPTPTRPPTARLRGTSSTLARLPPACVLRPTPAKTRALYGRLRQWLRPSCLSPCPIGWEPGEPSTLGRRSAVRSQPQAVIGWLDAVRELAREPRIIEIDMHVGQHGALGLDLRNP